MDAFLEPALSRLAKEGGRRASGVKKAAMDAQTVLARRKDGAAAAKDPESPADELLQPLLLACGAKVPKIAVIALDCLQKLMSYGFLRGRRSAVELGLENLENLENREKKDEQSQASASASNELTVMDVVVRTICACEDTEGKGSPADDSVQLQVIKALLTAVTSPGCGVHETSLLNSVRACYHIYLYSRNPVNKTTAKATLTQMMNSIFQQMELADHRIEKEKADENGSTNTENEAAEAHDGKEVEEDRIRPPLQGPHRDSRSTVLQGNMYGYVEEMLEFKVPLERKFMATAPQGRSISPFKSIQHKDAYLLFRALCKLSMKNQSLVDGKDGDDMHTPDPVALRSKVLSLDLVLNILEASGPAFRESRDFIYAIKTYLCSSLVKNSVSTNTQVVGLSLRIFVALQSRFSQHLKEEIELVISQIFLPLLESSNSPHEHKVLVLEVIEQICRDVETLVSIFLNYDCDWDRTDVYTRIVKVLSKMASEVKREDNKTETLHAMSLRSMVSIVESLAEFTHLEDQLPGPSTSENDIAGTSGNPQEELKEIASPTEDDLDTHGGGDGDNASLTRRSSASVGRGSTSVNGDPALMNTNLRKSKVDSFQQKQKFLRDIERASSKFFIKPKRGIDFLVENGYIDNTPEDVATALLEFNDHLSKTMIGEYLGEEKDFNVKTLHCYVDQFHFKERLIDEALREFLSGFRLPGEAQKIDRMMEKFAARYYEDNPHSFPSADTAYVLAFSIIMLNTDLHNPNIPPERKMTIGGFLLNNKGIAGGRDFDSKFLIGIYDRIKKNPITLKEDESEREKLKSKKSASSGSSLSIFGARDSSSKYKRAAFSRERQEILQSASSFLARGRQHMNLSMSPAASPSRKSGAKQDANGASGRQSIIRARSSGNGLSGLTSTVDQESNVSETNGLEPGGETREGSSSLNDTSYLYDSNDHVRPMFAVTWAPFCAVFSVNLQNTDEFVTVTAVVNGMKAALRVACRFSMEDERRTLFDALIKFTLLNSTQEMKQKHMECIRALVEVVQHEGDYLGASWEHALMCFSQLARLQLISGGPVADSIENVKGVPKRRRSINAVTAASSGGSVGADSSLFFMFQPNPSPAEQARARDTDNAARLMKSVDLIQIDRVFLDSVNLSTNAIVDMVNALCEVSRLELQLQTDKANSVLGRSQMGTGPRIFSLQKIVEVADSNMDIRPRFVWGKIWSVLSEHFTAAGCHRDVKISMYAIDFLRQLTVKFLEKDELAGFNFQLQFMAPFEDMMEKSDKPELRDLVLRCCLNIILTKSQYLKSGWRVMLHVVSEGGNDKAEDVHNLAFQVLERIVEHHVEASQSYFPELVSCLFAFAANNANEYELSEKAMNLMKNALEDLLYEPDASFSQANQRDLDRTGRLWAIFRGIASLLGNDRVLVKMQAAKMVFEQIPASAFKISPEIWTFLLRGGLLGLFAGIRRDIDPISATARETLERCERENCGFALGDDARELMRYPVQELSMRALLVDNDKGFTESLLYKILSEFVDLMSGFVEQSWSADLATPAWKAEVKKEVLEKVLEDLLHLLETLALSNRTDAACAAVQIFGKLVSQIGYFCGQEQWKLITNTICLILEESTPQFLLNIKKETLEEEDENMDLPFDSEVAFTMSTVQLQMLEILGRMLNPNIAAIDSVELVKVLDQIADSIAFARKFNDDLRLRLDLQKRGFMSDNSDGLPPSLLRQETLALDRYIHLLFRCTSEPKLHLSMVEREGIEKALEKTLHKLFMHYLFQDRVRIAENEQDNQASSVEGDAATITNSESEAELDLRFFTPVVAQSLHEILLWDIEEMRRNLQWCYPLLTALLDCGNREVHAALRQIFDQQISALLDLNTNKNE